MPARPPLTTLLSWAWIASTIECDNVVEAAASERLGRLFRISLPMWANGLRLLDEDGISAGRLQARARAGCNVAGLERWGWLTVGDASTSRRSGYGSRRGITSDTVVRPTRAGIAARRLWPRAVDEVEHRWRARFGTDVVDAVAVALRHAVTTVDRPMPWSPPEVHPSNGFRATLVEDDVTETDEELDVPFVALLGQVLTARTVEHERHADASLPLAADLLRVVDGDTCRVRDLPARSGLAKEAVATATNFAQRRALATVGTGRTIRLTATGSGALDDYRCRAAERDDPMLRGALEDLVSRRDALADGLVPPDGCWRGEKPFVTRTRRMLDDPTAALPWHPMVLHRGGWPDGS